MQTVRTWVVLAVIGGLVGVGFWSAAQIATTEQTAALPAAETQLSTQAKTRIAAASRATQDARAQQVPQEPVTYRQVIQPPRASMAARTGVSMGAAWSCTLEAVNLGGTAWFYECPVSLLGLGGVGSGVTLRNGGNVGGDPQGACANAAGDKWCVPFELILAAGGTTQTLYYGLETTNIFPPGGGGGTRNPANADVQSMVCTYTASVSGLYLKRSRSSSAPSDRQMMNWSDQVITDVWVASDNVTLTATVTGPDGRQLTYTGPFGGYSEGEEVEIGDTYQSTVQIIYNKAPAANTVYGRIRDINWGTSAVGGSQVYLYKPGLAGDIPDPTGAAGWSRTWTTNAAYRVSAGNTVEMVHLTGTTSVASNEWDGTCLAPMMVTVYPLDAKFDASGPDYGITYTSNFETWDADTSAYIPDEFSEPYGIVQSHATWLYEYEWRRYTGPDFQVRVTDQWRTDNNEDVGGSTASQNDALAAICTWGLTETNCTDNPWWASGFGFTCASSIDINDTEGMPSRASPWTAGAGVTVDPGDNDLWTVAAGATAPVVLRSLATRYWLRMNRLSGGYTPGAEYHPDWPIMLKANLDIGTTGDDPDWWDSGAGGVDSEDITNWANRRYLLLGINAARAGTVRLTVTYTVPHPSDPCYTCADHRWGEFSYDTSTYTRSYDVAVSAGANSKLIDLVLNREKASITGAYRMHIVDSVSIALPANPSGSPEAYTLTGLELVLDPGEGARAEPASHHAFRFVPSWDWINNRWFGFGGVTDGKDVLELEYGYTCQNIETKLAYVQESEHCPESGLETRLDAAKTLGRLHNELSWQEGFTPTWPSPGPEGSAENKDADDGTVDSSLYWWDVRQSTENLTLSSLEVALCAGTYNLVAGVEYTLYVYKYPRGGIHGIAVNTGYTSVFRNETDLVDVIATGPTGTSVVDALETDEHGRFRFDEAYETAYLYRLDGGGTLTSWLACANREYTTNLVDCAQLTPVHPCLAEGYLTDMHLAFTSEGTIYYRRMPTTNMAWEGNTTVVAGDYPCIVIPPDNCPVMAYETSGTVAWLRSPDHGQTWESIGMATSGTYPVAAEANGIQYLVTYTSGVGQLIRRSQDYFSTLLTFNGATSALVVAAGSTNAERVGFLKLDTSGRLLWTAVPYNNRVYHYGSYNDGETWVSL